MTQRPSFAASFAKALAISAKKRGMWAYLPGQILITLSLGAAVAWFVPEKFWTDAHWSESATVYGGMLAFNALLLAVGWGAFAKIYEIIGATDFAAFLRRHDMLDLHILFVSTVHAALATASAISFGGLVSLLLPLPLSGDRVIFGLMIGSSVYSLIQAMRATTMMNDLIWDKAHSEPATAPALKAVPSR